MIEECANALNKGEVILFPTDTVWGLLARSDIKEAEEKIYSIKKRPGDKPLVQLINHKSYDSDIDLKTLSKKARRVVDSFWPGPLTVITPTNRSFRLPNHDGLRKLLDLVDGSVVATSANISGESDPKTLEEVPREIQKSVSAIGEGEAGQSDPSTVVKFTNDDYEIFREGPISSAQIKDRLMCQIVFVCTGNTCRSPMAEVIAKDLLKKKLDVTDLNETIFEVKSAGMAAMSGQLPSKESVVACQDVGLDLREHRSKGLEAIVEGGLDFVYGMTASHVWRLRDLGINAGTLNPAGQDIVDPFGAPLDVYRKCRDEIYQCIESQIEMWLSHNKNYL